MQESKIFLCASRYESFGLAAHEAAACGCRVVSPYGCLTTADVFQAGPRESLLCALQRCRDFEAPDPVCPHISSSDPLCVAEKFVDVAKSIG
jgi:glycosyltransferase involved in cell wall biosynthesis